MINLIRVAVVFFFFTNIVIANEIGDSVACKMPSVFFKYSYLDTILNTSPAPSDNNFIVEASEKMDVSKAQIFLWYVYRNPRLAAKFFNKVSVKSLAERREDSINSILWLMTRASYLAGNVLLKDRDSINDIVAWKAAYDLKEKYRAIILDLYANDKYSSKKFSRIRPAGKQDDVDMQLQMGIMSENSNHALEALYYYTQVASYGYRGGLIGSALELPVVGGKDCVERAAYYVLLSGTTGPITWWTLKSPPSKGAK